MVPSEEVENTQWGREGEPNTLKSDDSNELNVMLYLLQRNKTGPDYYGVQVYLASEQQKESQMVTEALSSAEKEEWSAAMPCTSMMYGILLN